MSNSISETGLGADTADTSGGVTHHEPIVRQVAHWWHTFMTRRQQGMPRHADLCLEHAEPERCLQVPQ